MSGYHGQTQTISILFLWMAATLLFAMCSLYTNSCHGNGITPTLQIRINFRALKLDVAHFYWELTALPDKNGY